jgi:glycine hydroxymethyltransferase
VTTRGFGENEMIEVGKLIALVVGNIKSEAAIAEARRRVAALTEKFPLYGWRQQLAAAR